ncbi:MAG TPA: 2-succinyl-5-enolpyruvyl-6-hydroxy-3-cyclohexene-1-carboxylic-acid synthase [Bacillales bacterium]|nr:2-succinyl-5-enolpyruvyl-6-hydroxy-3-cyclohexene-1-carboxylic-acid synthase [Bacillales bacterium]
MADGEVLGAYVGAFVDELSRSDVHHTVICPGSRSTPLAMLMAEHPELKVWMHVDERSAAYFALGMAKSRREPVAILCSSGTAAANFFPAIVEAYESHVPLIVLTADRPHELRDVGAPQAIDQLKIYGNYVKWFTEMALPESSEEMLRYVRTVAGRAAATALTVPGGPVHLNFPFREPLVPNLSSDLWASGRERHRYVSVSEGRRKPDHDLIRKFADELKGIEQGLIVCGPQDDSALPEVITRLAEKLQYPVLADPLSQLRSGTCDKKWIIDGYDAFLRDESVTERYVPKVILRFGAMPVSKSFMKYVRKHPQSRLIVVDDKRWREPTQLASDRVEADPVSFCEALICEVNHKPNDWGKAWFRLNEVTKEQVLTHGVEDSLSEGQVFAELPELMPRQSILFVGNSMPVRDFDTFFMKNDLDICTMANRGANGIDGVVSSAIGASSLGVPLVLVIGDLSFYHDLNGLLAAKLYRLNVTIVVINNNGGGIFSFLPQARETDHFEDLFGTPTDLEFGNAVEMYGGSFCSVETWPQFRDEVKRGVSSQGLNVVEVRTKRDENTRLHHSIWEHVSRAVGKGLMD